MPIEYRYTNFYDDYKKLGLLGNGTYGKIYEVVNIKTGEKYAVKIVSCDSSREIDSSIYSEIAVLQKLNNHKNIIKLLKIFFSDTTIYYFFPIYKYNLAEYFSEKKITEEDAHKIKINLLEGLYALHSNGFAHYDIKPHNIMLNDCDDVVFIDFGLSVILHGSNHSIIKSEKQTLTYRAPEVFFSNTRDVQYNFKADIWTLGVIFYELYILSTSKPCISYVSTIINPMDESKVAKKSNNPNKKKDYFSSDLIESKYRKIYGSKQLLKAYSIPYRYTDDENGDFFKYFPNCPKFIEDMLLLRYWERPPADVIIKNISDKEPAYVPEDGCIDIYKDEKWTNDIYCKCLDNIYTFGYKCKFKEIVMQNAYELLYVISISKIIPPEGHEHLFILSIVCLLISAKLYDCRYITADWILTRIKYESFEEKIIKIERQLLVLLNFNIYHISPFNYLLQRHEIELLEKHHKMLFAIYYFRLRIDFTVKEVAEKCLKKEVDEYVKKLPEKYY